MIPPIIHQRMWTDMYYTDAHAHNKGGEGTMGYYVNRLVDGFTWKAVLSILGSTVAVMEGFYGSLLWGFLGLFTLDLLTGIMRSKHLGIPITSRRLRSSVTKLASYMILLTALIITSKHDETFIPIVSASYYYFMFTEFKSILENVEQMGVKVPDFIKFRVDEKIPENKKNEKTRSDDDEL